jgi:hypothetical protein
MQALRLLNAAILSALVATSAALYAQDEKPEEKPQRQEEPRPEGKQDETKTPRQDEAKPPKEDSREEKNERKQEEKQSKEMKQDSGNAHGRPAGKSGHIPDDRFRSNFGRSHTFVVQRTVVQDRPGFVYGGYSFVLVDAWPAEWAYTDDCYVDYVDGDYFLFDMAHPGIRLALFVVM